MIADFEESRNQGNSLYAREIRAALQRTPFAEHLVHLPEVGSTSDLALEAAQAGRRAGVWVADAQTAGRGRGGHSWHSAPGNGLYVSALVAPRLPASALTLSLGAGLAAWEAVRAVTGLTVDLRWPNDVVTRPLENERSRKLGGVLVETSVEPAVGGTPPRLRYAVIGVGINVAHRSFPPALASEASSLFLEGWQRPERQPLLIALLDQLWGNLQRLEQEFAGEAPAGEMLHRLEGASTWLRGKRVSVPEAGGYTGVTAGLDPQGFLRVASDDGVLRTVRSGGVREV